MFACRKCDLKDALFFHVLSTENYDLDDILSILTRIENERVSFNVELFAHFYIFVMFRVAFMIESFSPPPPRNLSFHMNVEL